MSKQLARTVINGFNHQPAMLSLAHADLLIDAIYSLASADVKDEHAAAKLAQATLLCAYGYSPTAEDKPFAYADGIAFIPIHGLLINRFSWSWSWVTGYNFIRNQLNAALEDDDVKLIVFDVNSGGGMVAGCFELAFDIRASREIKPSVSVVDAASYSAAYALASSASKVVVTPSGGVGSIGVVAMHVDYSKMLDEAGIKVTFIHSGDHKVDGNPYEALPAPVKADIQKSVDTTRTEFVSLVADNRGLDPKVVYDTEARCFSAAEALTLGLIDAIAPPLEAVKVFVKKLSDSETTMEKSTMSNQTTKPGAESSAAATEQSTTATAVAPVVAQIAATDERAAERERIKGITSHAEAAGREKLANTLALETDMSVDQAARVLAASAKETPIAANVVKSAFETAMESSAHPEVGVEANGDTNLTMAQQILKSQSLATGVKLG